MPWLVKFYHLPRALSIPLYVINDRELNCLKSELKNPYHTDTTCTTPEMQWLWASVWSFLFGPSSKPTPMCLWPCLICPYVRNCPSINQLSICVLDTYAVMVLQRRKRWMRHTMGRILPGWDSLMFYCHPPPASAHSHLLSAPRDVETPPGELPAILSHTTLTYWRPISVTRQPWPHLSSVSTARRWW